MDEDLNLPYLDSDNSSKIVADLLNALYSARRTFCEAENSYRLKRALKERIYVELSSRYISGDIVYYKREKTWYGPATVIAQYGKLVLLKSGAMIIKCAPCHIRLKEKSDRKEEEIQDHGDDRRQTHHQVSENRDIARYPEYESDHGQEDEDIEGYHDVHNETDEDDVSNNIAIEREAIATGEEMSELEEEEPESEEQIWKIISNEDRSKGFQPADVIRYKASSEEYWTIAIIMSRGGRVTGKNKHYYNILIDGQEAGLHTDKVEVEKLIDKLAEEITPIDLTNEGLEHTDHHRSMLSEFNPEALEQDDQVGTQLQGEGFKSVSIEDSQTSEEEVSFDIGKLDIEEKVLFIEDEDKTLILYVPENRYDEEKILKAKSKELEKWEKFNVFQEQKDTGQETLSTRWVLSDHGGDYKARLVVRGYEEMFKDKAASPTVDKSNLRIFFAITAAKGWILESLDIKAAFIQSDMIDREVYLRHPKDLKKTGVVWKTILVKLPNTARSQI